MNRRRLMQSDKDICETSFCVILSKPDEQYNIWVEMLSDFYLSDNVRRISNDETVGTVRDFLKKITVRMVGTSTQDHVIYDCETFPQQENNVMWRFSETVYTSGQYRDFYLYINIEWNIPDSELSKYKCDTEFISLRSSYLTDDDGEQITEIPVRFSGDIRSLFFGENVKGKKISYSLLYSDHSILESSIIGYLLNGLTGYVNMFYDDDYINEYPNRYLRSYLSEIPDGATKPRWQLYFEGGGKLTLFKRILSFFKSLVKKGGEVC